MAVDPYASIAAIYDHWCAEVDEDLAFYDAVAAYAQEPILELGAGTGRITVRLAADGHRVIALERSRPMLDRLVAAATAAGLADRVVACEGDIESLPPLPPVDRVLAPFRVFLHLPDEARRLRVLERIHELLVPGGLLAFDVFCPTRADIRATDGRELERPSGVRETATWRDDVGELELAVAFRGHETTMFLHYIDNRRWPALLERVGFEVVGAFAGFDGTELRSGRGDAAYVARRR